MNAAINPSQPRAPAETHGRRRPATDAGPTPANTTNTTPGDTKTAATDAIAKTRPRKPRRLPGKARIEQAIAEHAARLAADAPPLSPEQRRRIAELFAYTPPQ